MENLFESLSEQTPRDPLPQEEFIKSTGNSDPLRGLKTLYERIWRKLSPSQEKGKNGISVIKTPIDWIQEKQRLDNIGPYWRVHDKLYDLNPFIPKHPGGSDWISVTLGTDITEAFESSHILNVNKVEAILAKYYVKEAEGPRASPYLFKDDGFYKTLKRRVEPVLKEFGTGPSRKLLLTQDLLAATFFLVSLTGAVKGSILLQILGGLILGMCVVGAHNFIHLKDTWRRFYFDLSPLSSYEWRITHGLSHHLYPNTSLDYEVTALQPLLEVLPLRRKNLVQRYGSLIYSHLIYTQIMFSSLIHRGILIAQRRESLRAENVLIFLELLIFLLVAPTLLAGALCWFLTFSAASFWVAIVGLNAAHHHPACFHEGDERRADPDFGLCQLDSTLDKADEFHKTEFAVLTTFGEHPLHHLFPSVDHSKLPLLKPVFQQVLQEFLEKNRHASQLELFIGTHRQYARVKGWSHQRQRNYQFGEY